METISKHIGEGFGKGELYAALAFDATDQFGGIRIKRINLYPVSGHGVEISTTWTTGITGAAISIGDYSNALAFGAISEHMIGIVSHLSGSFDDDSNAIPILGKFTTTEDSDSTCVMQCILGQGVCSYNLADMYGVRGSITVSGTPTVNQIYPVFATLTLSSAVVLDTTGMLAAFAADIVDASSDVTRSGSTARFCGLYINWNVTKSDITVPTTGMLLNVTASAYVDDGIVVHGGYVDAAFVSSGTSHTVAFEVRSAHAQAFKFPAIGTSPCSAYTTEEAPTGKIKIKVGTAVRYLAYWD